MPKKFLMSWEPARLRWTKMYRGQRFLVTCEQLNAPLYTKEASYKLANVWWERKLAELNRPSPEEELLNRYRRQDLLDKIREGVAAQHLLNLTYRPDQQPPINPHDLHVPIVREEHHRNLDDISHFVGQMDGKPLPKNRSVAHQIKRYLVLEQARNKAASTYQDMSFFMAKLENCPVMPKSVDDIKGGTIEELYLWIRNDSGLAQSSQWKMFAHFRRFVRWLWESEIIQAPRNLDSRKFSFPSFVQAVKVYDPERVREFIKNLPAKKRLWALLAANCGFLSVDMGRLRHDEWKGNTITRKRTKTAKHQNTPVVCYSLWPETLDLLNQFKSKHPEFVLATGAGNPLWGTRIVEGKTVRSNIIHTQWHRQGRKSVTPEFPLKAFRTHSATLLESHKDYSRCVTLFLGHSPKSMKDRHYAAPPQALFDEALTWLRGQFFG